MLKGESEDHSLEGKVINYISKVFEVSEEKISISSRLWEDLGIFISEVSEEPAPTTWLGRILNFSFKCGCGGPSLRHDLGVYDLIALFEDEFGVEITDEEVASWRTVKDVVGSVKSLRSSARDRYA